MTNVKIVSKNIGKSDSTFNSVHPKSSVNDWSPEGAWQGKPAAGTSGFGGVVAGPCCPIGAVPSMGFVPSIDLSEFLSRFFLPPVAQSPRN